MVRDQQAAAHPSELGVCWNEFDMRILQNLAIHAHERRIKNASRCDDDLVGRIAMELARKLSGLDANVGRKFDEANAGIRERLLKPIEHGTRQRESSALDELGDLPARNGTHCNASLLRGIQ